MTLYAYILQGSRHWFDIILTQQFPSFWGNRSLLANLCALSLHGLLEHESRGTCIINLPLIFSILIETEISSFSIFSSDFDRKKWKYGVTNRLYNLINFQFYIFFLILIRNIFYKACKMFFLKKNFFCNLSSHQYKRVYSNRIRKKMNRM